MTWRRLGNFLDQLPPESQMRTAVTNALGPARLAELAEQKRVDGDVRFGPWTHEAHLLAAHIERVASLEATLVRVKGGEPAPIMPIPRPGVAPDTTPFAAGGPADVTSSAQVALLRRHQARENELQRIAQIKREAEQHDLTRGS